MDVQLNARLVNTAGSIAAGATASGIVRLGGLRAAALVFGAGYIGTTASFKALVTAGSTPRDVYGSNGVKTVIPSAAASRAYELPSALLVGYYGMKVIGATKQTTTAGAAPFTVVGID